MSQVPSETRLGMLFVAFLLFILSVAFLMENVLLYTEVIDDAFISFRYARNLVNNHGLVFNIGERVEGYSNLLWTLLMAGIIKLGIDVVLAAKFVSILFGVANIVTLFLLARSVFEGSSALALLAAFLLAVSTDFVSWSFFAMETQMFTFFLLAGFYSYIRPGGQRLPLASAILFALASLTRIEGVFVFAFIILHAAIWRSLKGGDIRDLLLWLAAFGVVYIPYTAWRVSYYGDLLPNTYYAKMGGGIEKYMAGLKYAKEFLASVGGPLIFLLSFLPLLRKGGLTFRRTAIWSLIICYWGFAIAAGGDWMPHHRFFVPILPLMIVIVMEGGIELFRLLGGRGVLARMSASYGEKGKGIMLGALFLLLLFARPTAYFIDLPQLWEETRGAPLTYFRAQLRRFLQPPAEVVEVAALGKWMRENLPTGSTIALEDIGMIPYYSGLRTIDAFGLTDPHIARLPGLMHQKYDVDYILSREPDYILLHVGKTFVGGFPNDRAMMASREFQRNYRWHSTHQVESGNSYFLIFERHATPMGYQVIKDFLADFPEATVKYYEDGEERIVDAPAMDERFVNTWRAWFINNELRTVLYEHPYGDGPTAVIYTVLIPPSGALLKLSIALDPATWSLEKGDGVLFEVYLTRRGQEVRLLSQYVDARNRVSDRKWHDFQIDLADFSGEEIEISFETSAGPAGDARNDWAGWGNPMLILYP